MRTREDNLEAKAKLLEVRHRIREMTAKNAELSAFARGCLPMRNYSTTFAAGGMRDR